MGREDPPPKTGYASHGAPGSCCDPLQPFLAHPTPCPLPANPVLLLPSLQLGHKKMTQYIQGRLNCRAAPGQRHSLGQLHCIADQHRLRLSQSTPSAASRACLHDRAGGEVWTPISLHTCTSCLRPPTSHLLSFGAAEAEPGVPTLARCYFNRHLFRDVGEWNEMGDFCLLFLSYFISFSRRSVKMFCDVLLCCGQTK